MGLPRAVQRQEDEANRLIEEAARAHEAANTPATPPANTETVPPQQATPPVEAAPPAQPQDRTDWKGKYLVLDGKYRAEVPRMAEEIRQLKADNAAKQARIEQLLASTRTPATPAPAGANDSFDPDLMSEVERRAAAAATAAVETAVKPIVERSESEAQQAAQASWDRFSGALDLKLQTAKIADSWQEMDHDPEWLAYLREQDAISGMTYQQLLTNAATARDENRAFLIYSGFAKKYGRGAPATPAAPAAPAPRPQIAATDVAPAPGSSAGSVPPQKPVYTAAEVAAFYADVSKGKYRGREATQAEIEARIDEAMRDGRIRP